MSDSDALSTTSRNLTRIRVEYVQLKIHYHISIRLKQCRCDNDHGRWRWRRFPWGLERASRWAWNKMSRFGIIDRDSWEWYEGKGLFIWWEDKTPHTIYAVLCSENSEWTLRRSACSDHWKPWTVLLGGKQALRCKCRVDRYGGGPLSEIEMMDGEMDQRASCINEDSLLLGSSIWPANMRYVPWRTNKQHTPNAGHTNVLFKFTFPSQILPYRLITSTRTVACHKSQTSSPPSMLFHMECGQGGLPKIKMNMRGPGRWQSC